MAGALDHFLRGLDIVLKSNQRASAEREAEREQRKTERSSGARATPKAFNGPSLGDDPSCCLAKRRLGR